MASSGLVVIVAPEMSVVTSIFDFSSGFSLNEMLAALAGAVPVAVPHVVVMKFKGHKVAHEHIYWDQACVHAQIGLLDPSKLAVTGAQQAEALVEKSRRKRARAS